MPIEFDFEGARKSGATDKDISGYFKEKYSIDFDIEGAKKNGANDADILDYLNTKYSEPVKKKEPTIGLGYEKPSEALRMGGLPKQEKLSQSPSKTAETTTQLDFTRPQPRLSAEEQQAQGMVTKQVKAEKALEFKEGVKQKLYDNNRYWLLQNKKEAQENGMTLKELQASRRKELANNYLDDSEQREANSILDHLDAKKSGDEKRAGEALKQYYAAKNEQRAKFQSDMQNLQAEYDNIASRIEGGELDASLGLQTLSAIEKRQKNLEIGQKAFLKPKEALKSFVQENATEIASVSKPTQTPYEQLEEYTNNLYAKVRQLKADLGYQDMGKGATLGGYAQDYAIRAEQDGGELLDELYAEELKLKTATKLLLLNRTPIQADETALGVLGKSFGNSLAPNLQKEQGTALAIANNVKEIIEDAKIGEKVYEEQKKFAEESAKPYETYSAKWFAEPVGASLAIVPEFVIGSLVSEGVLGVTKLGKLLTIAEKYGKIKGLNTTAKYVNAINKSAAGKVADTIGKTFIKTQANGLKFGLTSEVVSKFFPSQEDELNFTTGYFGGVIGKGAESALSGAVKNMFKVFGNKGTDAIKRINEFGGTLKLLKDAPKTVIGEIGEEFGESLGQIYKESDSWKQVGEKIKEQYGTLDKATEFVVLTGIMALGMGSGNSIGSNLFTASKEAYNNLPREQRAIVDSILDQAKAADKQVEETVAEDIKKDIAKDLTPIELKEIETTEETTDGAGTIEGAVSAGTDVVEEGLGVATEPGSEGITGEGVQAETVPQAPVTEGVESTVDNTIAADYLTTGGIGTVISTDYLLRGIAGFFTNANTLIDDIRNKYAKELSDKNLVDIKNFVGSDTYIKIVSDIKEALNKSYNNSAEIQNILDELLKMPTGMPQRIGFGLESRHNAELDALEKSKTTKPLAEQIADLRAEEQAEYDAMADPNDEVGREKIYNKYDKLITPLLEEPKAAEAAKVEPVKEAAKPTKKERKAIAEAKIDDLAAKAKEFLRNKNLPEGTQVSGISQNKVIDLMASTVKALVNSGIEISEAIKQVREFFEQDYDTGAVKDYEIAQAIARDELTDVAKENGFSSYREAVFAVNKYVREVGKEDVITKAEIEKAAKEKTKSEEEAKKAKASEKKGYTGRKKVSKFYKTALAYVQNTPTRLQEFLKANPLSYGVVTNAESIKKAIEYIEENGFEETLKDFLTKQIKTDGEFEKIIFVGYLLRGGLSEAFTDISKSMNGVTDADELIALKKEADRIFNDMKAVTTLLAEGYFPSFGRAIQAGTLFAQDLSTEDGAIFHFTKLTEQAAQKAREVNKQEATEQVNTVKEVVEEGTAKAAKAVTEYIVKSKDVQARNTTKLSKARKAAADAKEKLKAALAKYKILGIANDPWEQAKNDVATVKALTDYIAAQLKYKSVQAGQIIKEVAALLGINARYIPKADIQEIMDAAKKQAEKDMTFDEITNVTTPKGVAYAERVGKELSNDPSAINKTVESIIQDYYMGNQTLDEIIDMVKQRFDVTDAQAITIAKQIQSSINDNITKALEKQLDKKIKQLNDKRLKEEGKKPPKERKPVKSLYDIMAQAQVMGVLDTDSVQAILEELYNVPTVTPEDIQFVKDTYAKINNTGDLTRKAQLIADLHKRFASKNPTSFYDVYNSYWYSAVLSGPSTTDVNAAFGIVTTTAAILDVISGAFINSVKIISDKFKGKQNPSSIALEARLIFDSFWRTIFQTGTVNIDGIKRGSLFKKESLPLYESVQNLVSTLKRGPQAFNEELRNTDISVKDNAYLKDYKPTGIGKLISPFVWIDKKTGIFSFLPKYVPRVINAVDIFFGTALKNLNLAQILKTYYVRQGLSGKDLATAIKNDLNKSPELLFAARELAANDRLNIDLEIKKENGEFVVYDTGKKKKSFRTESAAKKYMTELSYEGDKYQKGVVDYLNATLPPDVVDASRRIAASYVCTGDVEGVRSKWFYNNIILNIRKATMDWADSKEQSFVTRAIKFSTSRVVEFMKFPLNFNNLAIAYTPALAFLRAKYKGDEASLYAQVYKDKAQQRFLTGFAMFMAATTPALLSMLILKSPDDEEEDKKEDLKRRQELADKFFKDTGEKVDIENPLFNLPKDGELVGSLSFLSAKTKKFLKENNLAVPFRRWNAKLNIWEDYTISQNVYNLSMAASLSDYVKYVINDKTRFNSEAQRAKEWQNVVSYFAGNLVQTFVNASGIKSQNQLLLTLNSGNHERILNAAVDMVFSPVQSTPALLRQLSEGLDMRLKQRVEAKEKPFEYVASKTIPLGGLFFTGKKKHDMFGDEIAYLTGADRGFVLKHLFSVTQKEYEKERTELGQFLNINGYSKYRDLVTEYEKKNKEIIDIKNPTVEINGIAYTNYLDKGFTDEEMSEIGLAAAKRAKQVLIDNKVLLQEIGNATNLEEIPLISADYKIPFTEAIDKIYDTIFEEEWKSALVKKNYVNKIGAKVYKAEEVYSKVIPIELKAILVTTKIEKKIPIKAKIPIEFQDIE